MVLFLIVLALFVVDARAEVDSIVPTHPEDGVYFVTKHRLRGTDHGRHRKVYRWNDEGVELAAQQGDGPGWDIESIRETRDGKIQAINARSPCRAGSICVNTIQEHVAIHQNGASRVFPGEAWIAPDGSSALIQRYSGFGFVPNPDDRALKRLDLTVPNAEPISVGALPSSEGQWFAEDGSALIFREGRFVLLRADATTDEFRGPIERGDRVVISSDGEFAITCATSGAEAPYRPLQLTRRTGGHELLAPSGLFASLSDDDQRLLYLAPVNDREKQLFLMELPGQAVRQVTATEGGYREAMLSGDGMTAYGVTHDGLLHRIDLRDDFVEEIVGPMPKVDRGETPLGQVEPRAIAVAPGSTYRLRGIDLAPRTVIAPHPAPLELEGMQVLVGGRPAAILWVSPWEIGYQVDWDTPLQGEEHAGEPHVAFRTHRSDWEDLICAHVDDRPQPALVDPAGFSVSIHQNFDRFVTRDDPAVPGEYVHAYVTGMGPVQPKVRLGVPAPVTPPFPVLATPCQWQTRFTQRDRPLESPYAGLAPGLIGFYQVVIRIPEDWREEALSAYCGERFVVTFPTRPATP